MVTHTLACNYKYAVLLVESDDCLIEYLSIGELCQELRHCQ